MRSENSIKSAVTAVISNTLVIVIGFIAQAVFLKTLGKEYLGVNGLFNNILSMLAIVEMGFGSAIIVNLYKPVAKNNYEKIKSLLLFYKKIYRIIVSVVSIIGIAMLPFLKYIVGEVKIQESIHLIFLLYLADTVASYLLTYKRSILYANQKNYIINIVHMGYLLTMNILQMLYLYFFKEFIGYLVIKIACRILENVILTLITNKKYSYVTEKNIKPLEKRLKKSILIRVKGLFFHRIGSFIVLGSDNIIISMMPNLGIGYVGLYSNYYLIINALNSLFGQIFTSLTSSVGNLLVEKNKERTFKVYKATLLLNSWIYSFAGISLYFISKPFICIWIGAEFLLDDFVVLMLVINFYINGMRRTYTIFKEAAGVYYQDRYVPIIESLVNITVSIILAYFWGLAGVVIGTIASNMVLFLFSFPKYVYKKILHGEINKYISENLQYAMLSVISFIITYSIVNIVHINNNWIQIIVYIIICLIIPNVIYLIFKGRSEEFRYYINLFKKIKNKFFNTKNKNNQVKEYEEI